MNRTPSIAASILFVLLLPFAMGATPTSFADSEREPFSPARGNWVAPAIQTEARTAELLATIDAPGRDVVSLTQRLKLHGSTTIPAVVNAFTPNYGVGTSHPFYVADVLGKSYYTITATVRAVTPHAYWYVKDGYRYNLKTLQASADHFERKIYPTNRRVFGPEASPGVDNDPRITVLMAPLSGVGGYFSSADAYPRVVNPYSNERDMIYIAGTPAGRAGDEENYFEATLAHEFQHMIEWNVKRDRDVWLDEGCSEVAMYLNGYDAGGADVAFLLNSDTQLNAWDEPPNSTAHYGASYLFLRYLMNRYGGERFVGNLLKEDGLGVEAINSAVKAAGNPAGFEGAFKDWTVANVLNDKTLAGGRYSYSEGGRVGATRTLKSYPATRSETVHQHAADYIKLTGSLARATITFKGSPTVRAIGADAHGGASYWYSNRRDSGDATLTREFDLGGVRSATLRFWAWYDIEEFFDYTYVVASTDGGRNWNALKGTSTTTENPNGTSYGPGWTGRSGVPAGSKATPRWVEESVDLSAYAGKRVLVRFEYVTDEGYNRPGFAVDNISVPEIGYTDGAESDNGWTAGGFVRIGSRMPQKWFVALVEKGSPNRVREMTVDLNGNGALDLSGLSPRGKVREAILVIAPLAPKTTEVASYTVTVRKK